MEACYNHLDEAVLTSIYNLCFWAKIRKIMYSAVNPTSKVFQGVHYMDVNIYSHFLNTNHTFLWSVFKLCSIQNHVIMHSRALEILKSQSIRRTIDDVINPSYSIRFPREKSKPYIPIIQIPIIYLIILLLNV